MADHNAAQHGAIRRVVGIISGTSADGIDVAHLRTDGAGSVAVGPAATYAYRPATRDAILATVGGRPAAAVAAALSADIEADHKAAFRDFCAAHGIVPADIDLVGFHGQTVWHDPAAGETVQLGDPGRFARSIRRPVVGRFRDADMAAGGEGAPIVPLYHAALAVAWPKPVAVLNVGGVSNVTYIAADRVEAFDIGPGNAPLDDWVRLHTGAPFDRDGALAASGTPDLRRVAAVLTDAHFARTGPRSLDRNAFGVDLAAGLSPADGAATLVAIAVAAIARAAADMVPSPARWLVCGGGRSNGALMAGLAAALDGSVDAIEAVGCNGDAIEAQAVAYLAVRARRGLPLTLPTTTGCRAPTPGGRVFDESGTPL